MCLAIPGRIIRLHQSFDPCPGDGPPDDAGEGQGCAAAEALLWRCATVDFGGVLQRVSLACLPQARPGDLVLVHVGLAIALVEGGDP